MPKPKEEVSATEQAYIDGQRVSLAGVLSHVVGQLRTRDGDRTNLEKLAILTAERENVLITIRRMAKDQGRSLDWSPDQNLADIIEKVMRPKA